MWISEDQRDPNFKPPTNRPGVTNPLYKPRKHELGAGDFIVYCLISTLVCFLLAYFLLLGFSFDSELFHNELFRIIIFLSIAPGIIIGAIIYNTQKHSSSNQSPQAQNNQEAPRMNNTTSASDKLIELKKLRDQDLITTEEFDKMKQEILKGLK